MYVTCPSCRALYSLTAEHLRLAGGQVRCSACQNVFDARTAVFDDPQQALDYQHPLQPDLAEEIDELVGRALDEVPFSESPTNESVSAETGEEPLPSAAAPAEEAGGADEVSAQVSAVDVAPAVSGAALPADADHYAQPVAAEFVGSLTDKETDAGGDLSVALLLEEPLNAARTAWGAIAAAFLLTFALIAQYAYIERYTLMQYVQLRPAIEWGCRFVRCDLPLRRDLARVEMIEREVRDHPHVDDALLINARFANRAGFSQAYPILQVSFSDISGTPVAVRRFDPGDYLQQGDVAQGMQPGEQTRVMLEVIDPGTQAVSFQFDFM